MGEEKLNTRARRLLTLAPAGCVCPMPQRWEYRKASTSDCRGRVRKRRGDEDRLAPALREPGLLSNHPVV